MRTDNMQPQRLRTSIGFILTITLSGCATQALAPPTESECIAIGGQWAGQDVHDAQVCTVTRKKCSSRADCEAACLAPLGVSVGDTAIGSCSNPHQVQGVFSAMWVENGRVVREAIED